MAAYGTRLGGKRDATLASRLNAKFFIAEFGFSMEHALCYF
jgi:hypothetical protein